jgi:hypothetical protein
MIRKLDTPGEWVTYGFAYFLEYLVPTFDFFPWSFGRLAGAIMIGVLLYKVSARVTDGGLFTKAEHGLELLNIATGPSSGLDAGMGRTG